MSWVCKKCGEDDVEKFYVSISTHCIECWKARVRENRRQKIEQYTAYERGRAMLPHRVQLREKYQQTPEGKAAIRRANKASWARYPERRSATIAVSNAIRDGKLLRQPCEKCGKRAQAHHDDYGKPLEVRWLCSTHHAEHHRSVA